MVIGLTDLRKSVDIRFSKGASDSELSQWLSLAKNVNASDLAGIEAMIATRTYLVGGSFSIADAALYLGIATSKEFATFQWAKYPSVGRYIAHIQSLCKAQKGVSLLDIAVSYTPVPIGCGISMKSKAAGSSSSESSTEAPASASGAADDATQATGENGKKDKKEKKEHVAAVPAASSTDDTPEPSQLDIRVGVIVKCWNHPESEKLLCEEVDMGETAPRSIASGIRAFYSAEEMVGKKVLVLANLKGRAIAGFKSEGMVLCACNNDHSQVALLDAPVNANAGDKVQFVGFEGKEPAPPNNMAKKKILEKLAPLLKTDAKGAAFVGKDQFLVNGQAVTSTMCSAIIS